MTSRVPRLIASDRIQEAFLVNRLPLESRLYLWPFLVAYVLWFAGAAWCTLARGAFNELLLIPLGLALTANFVTLMSVFWSVRAEAALSCARVAAGAVDGAELICVVPREHCGRAAIVPLVRQNGRTSFQFHHETLHYDADRKVFCRPAYPDQLPFAEYRQARGIRTQQGLEAAREDYGKNKYARRPGGRPNRL